MPEGIGNRVVVLIRQTIDAFVVTMDYSSVDVVTGVEVGSVTLIAAIDLEL